MQRPSSGNNLRLSAMRCVVHDTTRSPMRSSDPLLNLPSQTPLAPRGRARPAWRAPRMPRTGAETAGPAAPEDEESVLNFAPNLEPGSRLIDIEQAFRVGLTRVPDGFRIASPASFATVLGVSPLRCADALRALVEQGLVRPDGDRFVVVRAREVAAAPARYASIEEHLLPGRAFEPFGRPNPRDHRPLAPGQTALDLFPAAAWARFETRTIRMLG